MDETNGLILEANRLVPVIAELNESIATPVVLIDGRAGSGKSTFAEILQDALFQKLEQLPRLIHMDDLYPGWDGLQKGSLYLVDKILTPAKSGKPASWQEWDWDSGLRGGPDEGNGWRSFEGNNVLLVEGCGSISRASAQFAELRVWIEANLETRKQRFMERDNSRFFSYWNSWSLQEDEFYRSENSKNLCENLILN